VVRQPVAEPGPRKRKVHSRSKARIAHTPLDLQPIEEVFNEDAANVMVTSTSTNDRPLLDSGDLDYELDINLLPSTPTFPHPKSRKRAGRVLGGQNGPLHPKRLKKSEGLLPSDIDIVSNGESSLSTPLRSLPPATHPMVSVPL
jgi:hypothetical protein